MCMSTDLHLTCKKFHMWGMTDRLGNHGWRGQIWYCLLLGPRPCNKDLQWLPWAKHQVAKLAVFPNLQKCPPAWGEQKSWRRHLGPQWPIMARELGGQGGPNKTRRRLSWPLIRTCVALIECAYHWMLHVSTLDFSTYGMHCPKKLFF